MKIMIVHVSESSVRTHCIAHPSASYKCWTFAFKPTRLPSAVPGNQILPPRPLGFITESLFAELNRVTASHRSWVRSSQCAYREAAGAIISRAQRTHWQDQYIVYSGNFVFHRDHLKQTSRPPLLESVLLT